MAKRTRPETSPDVEAAFREGYAHGWRVAASELWRYRNHTPAGVYCALCKHWRAALVPWSRERLDEWLWPPPMARMGKAARDG